jgi:hypothetical protein
MATFAEQEKNLPHEDDMKFDVWLGIRLYEKG